ncbi:hypothetical protein CRG98_037213 [Punica granatum]|nr:hypothetical protein CRG98_037213 [Punica granatum]
MKLTFNLIVSPHMVRRLFSALELPFKHRPPPDYSLDFEVYMAQKVAAVNEALDAMVPLCAPPRIHKAMMGKPK